jgi:hypothetical protein
MKIGDRVWVKTQGCAGTIEGTSFDPYYDVRLDTPDGMPSVLVSVTHNENLVFPIPDNIIAMPWSGAKKSEAVAFCERIREILSHAQFQTE